MDFYDLNPYSPPDETIIKKKYNKIKPGTDLNILLMKALTDWKFTLIEVIIKESNQEMSLQSKNRKAFTVVWIVSIDIVIIFTKYSK